jgi:hypothetical protein
MIGARELFKSFIESESDVYVEFGMGTKHAVKGYETVPFQMELGGVLRVMNVLWVPELGRSVLSISTIEKKGFGILFQDGHVLIKPIGSSLDTTTVLGVRESNLYKLKGQPMRTMACSKVAVNQEQVALKVVKTQRELACSEGESTVQRKSTFRFRWERGVFQDCQEGVMG